MVERPRRARRRRGDPDHGLGAAGQADLAHRGRRAGGRQGHQRPQRLPRPEILGERLPAGLAGLARRADPNPRALRHPRPVRSCRGRLRSGPQPGLAALRRPDGRSRLDLRLGLGRAALPGLPGFRQRVGGCRELAGRPLDYRPHRGLRTRPDGRGDPVRPRRRGPRRDRGRRLPRRRGDRPAALGPRGAGAAGAGLRPRRIRGRRHLAPARPAARGGGGDHGGGPRPRLRGRGAVPQGAGRGEQPAPVDRDRLHRFREPGLPQGRRRRDPPRRRAAARDADRGGGRHPPRRRRRSGRGPPRPGHRGPRHGRAHLEPAPDRTGARRPARHGGRAPAHRPHRRRPRRAPHRGPRRAAARAGHPPGTARARAAHDPAARAHGRALRPRPRPARRPGHAHRPAGPRGVRRALARRARDLARRRDGGAGWRSMALPTIPPASGGRSAHCPPARSGARIATRAWT